MTTRASSHPNTPTRPGRPPRASHPKARELFPSSASSSPALGPASSPEQTGPRSLSLWDPVKFIAGPIDGPVYEAAQTDVVEPEILEYLKMDSAHIIEHVLHPALRLEYERGELADNDTWGLRKNLTEFPLMPCKISTWDVNQSLVVYQSLLQRGRDMPIYTEKAPLLTSINEVAQMADDLAEAELTGIPVTRIYVGAQVINRVNVFTRRWALHGHQANLETHALTVPWRHPAFVIDGRAEYKQPVARMRNICRALMSPATMEDAQHGEFVFTKTRKLCPHRGIYVVGYDLNLSTLIRCFDVMQDADQAKTHALSKCFGIGMIYKLHELVEYRELIEKYAQLPPVHTVKEARTLVARNIITNEELSILQEHNLLLAVTGTSHDAPAGTIPACAHVVSQVSGVAYSVEHLEMFNEMPQITPEAHRKPSSQSSTVRNTPTGSRIHTPLSTMRSIADHHNSLLALARDPTKLSL